MLAMSAAGSSNAAMGGGTGIGGSYASSSGYQLHDRPMPALPSESAEDGAPNATNDGTSEGSKDRSSKKSNPLADLIDTEGAYVAELGKIIKKVAGAWSRSNFPPAELDTMFRNVEAIYRINRSFLKSLKEIGPNPTSPRALGDLLMRWIDDMEAPYQRYCDNYFTDFDSWPTVQNNSKLHSLLESVSESTLPDGSPVIYSDRKRKQGQVWTMDQLFALPQTRLKYYKKLYSRLLKSTQEGRSDHRLLVNANEKLDELINRSKTRIAMSILDDGPVATEQRHSGGSSVGDTTGNTVDSGVNQGRASSSTSLSNIEASTRSLTPINAGREESKTPSFSAVVYPQGGPPQSPVFPQEARSTPAALSPSTSRPSTIDDLESRLDTSRTLDIFSMKPKKCQLRMNPPGIPFKRELRKAADVVIYFTPTTTGEEIVLRRAHLFLLTDLFLVCERMTAAEIGSRRTDSVADMWLLYPPLAGKHLRVQDVPGHPNAFTLVILKKESLIVHTDSPDAKAEWVSRLEDCQKFGQNMGLKVKTDTPERSRTHDNSLPASPAQPSALTPGLSPAISVTPSSRTENEPSSNEDGLVRDVTKLLDSSPLFSPHASISSSTLDRGNSFNSFVAPFRGPDAPQQEGPTFASQALSTAFSRSPDQALVASPPPLLTSSPGLRPGIVASPPPMNNFGSPPNAISPQTLNGRPANFNGGMPPRAVSPNVRTSPPRPPSVPPPAHLMNGFNGPQRPMPGAPRPPHMPNGMMGRPPPPPPPNGPGGPPFGMNAPSQPRPPMGRPPHGYPPFRPANMHQDITRRPSVPDMRDPTLSRDPRRSSEGPSPPLRSRSASSSASGPPKLPSDYLKQNGARPSNSDYSPPPSPTRPRGPKTSTVAAQMRCRLYLKQSHGQWKALGNARLKLYHLMPDDVKQLVVENDKKSTPLISSIIFSDGVERVGKVGVAVELSDNGSRTGIIYMLHLRSEESAFALFGQLLEGSDRTALAPERDAL